MGSLVLRVVTQLPVPYACTQRKTPNSEAQQTDFSPEQWCSHNGFMPTKKNRVRLKPLATPE